jgi:hypothetical protein
LLHESNEDKDPDHHLIGLNLQRHLMQVTQQRVSDHPPGFSAAPQYEEMTSCSIG